MALFGPFSALLLHVIPHVSQYEAGANILADHDHHSVTVKARESGRQKLDTDAYDGYATAGERCRGRTRLWGAKNM